MAQGFGKLKPNANKKSSNSAKFVKKIAKAKTVKKGAPLVLPKNSFRGEAVLDRQLSRAIDKANEQKVAAKAIQDGGRLGLSDVMQKGKELNREQKRSLVKRKVGRVEEKLNKLKAAEEGN